MYRNICLVLLFLCSIFVGTEVFAHEVEIESISFEGIEKGDDGLMFAHYNVTYSAPGKRGESILCLITPIDEEDEPYPNGKGSFHCAGNVVEVSSSGKNVLTVPVPTHIIKQIPGTDEYHLSVILGSEKGEPYIEELFALDYSILADTAKEGGMQKALDLLDSVLGGMGVSQGSGTYEGSELCSSCNGSGTCRDCQNGGDSYCHQCYNTGRCGSCNGSGYVSVRKKYSDW